MPFTPVDDAEESASAPAQGFTPVGKPEGQETVFTPLDDAHHQDESSNIVRGARIGWGQTVPILKGSVGLVGATAEKALGKGGYSSDLKNWGLEGYKSGMAELDPEQRENDSLTESWKKAKDGDTGALLDWAEYGLGYVAGQMVPTIGVAVAGGLAGTALEPGGGTVAGAASGVVGKGAIRGLIQREIAKRTSTNIAEGMAEEAARKAATRSLARDIGAGTALTAFNVAQEAGQIYPDAEDEAQKKGKELSGTDIARVWGASVLAGLTETAPELLGMEALTGRLKIPGTGRLGRALVAGGTGAAIEGGQEGIQTFLERWGADQSLTDEDALKDYVDSAALGALGGTAFGGAAGALSRGRHARAAAQNEPLPAEEVLGQPSEKGFTPLLPAPKRDLVVNNDGVAAPATPDRAASVEEQRAAEAERLRYQREELGNTSPNAPRSPVGEEPEAERIKRQARRLGFTPLAEAQAAEAQQPKDGGLPSMLADTKAIFDQAKAANRPAILDTIARVASEMPEVKASPKAQVDVSSALREITADPNAIFKLATQRPEVMNTIARATAEAKKMEVADNSVLGAQAADVPDGLLHYISRKGTPRSQMAAQSEISRRSAVREAGVTEQDKTWAQKLFSGKALSKEESRRAIEMGFGRPRSNGTWELTPAAKSYREQLRQEKINLSRNTHVSDQAVVEHFGARLGRTFTAAEMPLSADARAGAAVAKSFGKRVVWFSGESAVHGGFDPHNPDAILVNANSNRPHLTVIGHELLHSLRRLNEDTYQQLVQRLKPVMMGVTEYRNWLEGELAIEGKELTKEELDDLSHEELIGDFMGDHMMQPKFWAEVFRGQEKGFVQKIIDQVRVAIESIRLRLEMGSKAGYGTEKFIRDADAVRKALADAYNTWAKESQQALAEKELQAKQAGGTTTKETKNEPKQSRARSSGGSAVQGNVRQVERRPQGQEPAGDERGGAGRAHARSSGAQGRSPLEVARSLTPSYNPKLKVSESSLAKQGPIGKTYDAAAVGSPEYTKAVFAAYQKSMPSAVAGNQITSYAQLVRASYESLAKEVKREYEAISKEITIEYHSGEHNYASSDAMREDAEKNHHLWVYEGGERHEFLGDTDPTTGRTYNEMFRAIHDYFGHVVTGASFGPKGEEQAWASHVQMMPQLAKIAMTSETRGQNSFVNYSPTNIEVLERVRQLRRDGAPQKEIDAEFAKFQYAKQASVALPPEMIDPRYAGGMPEYMREAIKPEHPTEAKLAHYSKKDDLVETDPAYWGTGLNEALGTKLYDLSKDQENLRLLAYHYNMATPWSVNLHEAQNAMEHLIYERGYDGYTAPAYGAAAVFTKLAVKKSDVLLSRARSLDTGIKLTRAEQGASLDLFVYGDQVPPQFTTLRQAAEFIEDRAKTLNGGKDRSEFTEENAHAVSKIMAHEGLLAIKQSGSSIGWYRKSLERAIEAAAKMHPEIATDPDARFAFTYALAVTSNGTPVRENTRYAFEAYKKFQDNDGRMPFYGKGQRGPSMAAAFTEFNKLKKELGSVAAVREFMLSKHAVQTLKMAYPKIRELTSEEVYGGTVIGSKIGGGFLQNLNGNFDALTIDRWFMRMWGRMTARLATGAGVQKETGLIDSPSSGNVRAYARKTVDLALGLLRQQGKKLEVSDLQALLWYPEKDYYKMLGVADENANPTDYYTEITRYAAGKTATTAQGLEPIVSPERGRRGHAEPEPRLGEEARPAPQEAGQAEVDQAAHEAATSPKNELPEPTAAQKEAGNYTKGHVRISGLDVTIENPDGSERTFTKPNGETGSKVMKSHYGYIRDTVDRTEEHIDAFIKPGTPRDYTGPVYVIDQRTPKTGRFDEYKVMLGWPDMAGAKLGYMENYQKGWDGIKAISRFDNPEAFKTWLEEGDTKKPAADQVMLSRERNELPAGWRIREWGRGAPHKYEVLDQNGEQRGLGDTHEEAIADAATAATDLSRAGETARPWGGGHPGEQFAMRLELNRQQNGDWVSPDGRYEVVREVDGYYAKVDGQEIGWGRDFQRAKSFLTARFNQEIESGKIKNPSEAKSVFNRYTVEQTHAVTDVWKKIASMKGAFRFASSESTNARQIAKDIGADRVMTRITVYPPNGNIKSVPQGQVFVNFIDGTTGDIYFDNVDGQAYVNAADLKQGGFGAQLYQLALIWAHNNKFVLVPDPGGVTYINTFRRTEQMISGALRLGTTKYMRPHPDQGLHGWINEPHGKSDDEHNLALLLLTSYDNVIGGDADKRGKLIEELRGLRYNFASQKFEDASGKPISNEHWRKLADRDHEITAHDGRTVQSHTVGGGVTTLQRAVLTQSVLAAATERSGKGLAALVQNVPAYAILDGDHPLRGVLYSRQRDTGGGAVAQPGGAQKGGAVLRAALGAARVLTALGRPVTAALDLANRGAEAVLKVPGKLLIAPVTSRLYDRVVGLGQWLAKNSPLAQEVAHGLIADYGLPEPYLDARQDRETRIQAVLRRSKEMIDNIASLDRAQARVAYLWMQERPDTRTEQRLLSQLPPESRQALAQMKEQIDQLGQEAVKLGLLSQESFDRNRMAYLHRTYKKHELDNPWQTAAGSRAKSIRADAYRGRGLRDDVAASKLPGVAQGDKYLRLEERGPSQDGGLGQLQRVVYLKAGTPVPQSYANWRQDGVWEARWMPKEQNGQVGMWRDLSPEERQRLGEIDEVRYAFARTMLATTRDIETARFLKWTHETYAKSEAEVEELGGKIAEAVDSMVTLKVYADNEWVKVPSGYAQGTKIAKYGALAGSHVPAHIWNDIRSTMNLKANTAVGKLYDQLLRGWKISKTALSPAVHTNNVMSNFVLADMAETDFEDIRKALRTIIDAQRGDAAALALMERYNGSGAEGASHAAVELRQDIIEPMLKELEQEQDETLRQAGLMQAISLAVRGNLRQSLAAVHASKAVKIAETPFKWMVGAYHEEDTIFRLGKFLHDTDRGKTDTEAGRAARRAILDYNINAPWVQVLRRGPLPFLSFSYRAIPLLMETAAKRPWKMMKYFALGYMLNALAYAMLGAAGDEDKERKLMPDEKSGRALGVFYRMLRMPWNDDQGSPVFMDIRRWIPGGDIVDLNGSQGAIPLPSWLSVGGPLSLAVEMAANKDLFTGKPIVLDSDTFGEKLVKITDHLAKFILPNVPVPNPAGYAADAAFGERGLYQTYSWKSVIAAGTGETDTFGRERSLAQSVASSMGVKIGAQPADVAKRNLAFQRDSALREIGENITALRRERHRVSENQEAQENVDERIARQREKSKDIMRKYSDRVGLQPIP